MKIKLDYPIKIYKVPSSQRHPDTGEILCNYNVELYSNGKLICDCEYGQMGKVCRHKIKVYDYIKISEPERFIKPLKIKKNV